MPPHGLYPMGRHHLYGGQATRRTFNSKDFAPESSKSVETEPNANGPSDDVDAATQPSASQKKEKREKKEKKKKDLRNRERNVNDEGTINRSHAIADVGESHEKRKEKRKEKHKKKTEEKAYAAQETPVHDSEGRKKKRKRESDAPVETPIAARKVNPSFEVGGSLVEDVKASLHGLGASITRPLETPRPSDEVRSKKKKSSHKNIDVQTVEQPEPNDFAQTPSQRKPKTEKHKKRKSTEHKHSETDISTSTKAPRKTPVPLPKLPDLDRIMRETQTEPQEPKSAPHKTPVPAPRLLHTNEKNTEMQLRHNTKSVTGPKKTPVPPPRLSQPMANTEVVVPETPIRASKKTSTPSKDPASVSQPQSVRNANTERRPSRKEKVTVYLSTPTSASDGQTPYSASSAVGSTAVHRPTVPNALTDANLSNHEQPSNRAKPRARSGGAVSTITSFPESSSSRSIMDAFVRVGKPYSRSGAEVDPFVTTEIQAKKHRETHQEASMNDFNERFLEVQNAVNFSEEEVYLEDFLAWGKENKRNELPCLGNVTGCTTKREEILRLSKEENVTILGHLDHSGGDMSALRDAANRRRLAEELLMLSLKARVPVPIGRLQGTWTLYCPKYAETHFDRYGYGQRTLTISSIAGFNNKQSYTARLNIPPRSMSYSTLAFTTPPHASFRTTTIKTAAEGYTMDVVFLGNGYLQLRADLKLLLKGKATEESERKKAHMEFIGVHEKALTWFEGKNELEGKDELEEAGRKLFAKYDGSSEN